jgi:hypothetical protein
MRYLKKFVFWVVIVAIAYFILAYHYVLVGRSVVPLKKASLTLNYTIYNTKGKTNKTIMANKELREDGIGSLLVEANRMTPEELERWMEFYKLKKD